MIKRISTISIFLVGAILISGSCSSQKKLQNADENFEKYIMLNHLYVVVDDTTYSLLSDSLPLIKSLAYYMEESTNAGDEAWSGKYLHGQHHYIEIFKPRSYAGAKFGDFGMGLMPTKIGTADALYRHWKATMDYVKRRDRNYVENGASYPWFTSVSLKDSLRVAIWLMEHAKSNMASVGFSEDELLQEISYWDYKRQMRARMRSISRDSVKYERLFGKITGIKIALSEEELDYVNRNLLDMGFKKRGNVFYGNDTMVEYVISQNSPIVLRQLDIELKKIVDNEDLHLNRLHIKLQRNKASFISLITID